MIYGCNTVGIWDPTIWNLETFEIQTFWRSDLKWLGFSYGYNCDSTKHNGLITLCTRQTIQIPDQNIKTRWSPFFWYSNGWAVWYLNGIQKTRPLGIWHGPFSIKIPTVNSRLDVCFTWMSFISSTKTEKSTWPKTRKLFRTRYKARGISFSPRPLSDRSSSK